ncbi:Uncharacterized conserved secreted protein [Marinomonas sp. MED121]|uniref:endonuclease/exonuclease/phosphatase family protein n=1 Tax=Marinomonas sp. MED121 TaxID=314277 RepID=UPI000068FDD0|nr:endonuclease/exonuclease/phosphatase family protein [Marinomonas sp. MED121]EAQ65486.1 Uncharacterized conserved secreted protein [Marinomonas sp. MED121]
MVVRVATYNTALNRPFAGALAQALTQDKENSDFLDSQAVAVALVIRFNRPDILLLNEFDYDVDNIGLAAFCENYLENPSLPGSALAPPISYAYRFSAPVNTGLASGRDFDKDGIASDQGADALGFGDFPGQYGMAVLSQHPILIEKFRSFQHFLWSRMPSAKLPQRSSEQGGGWFDEADLAVLPLSSKSHWDLPIQLEDLELHLLCSHPTPPVFDGEERRNACRNHDEIRFWHDYIQGEDYMEDDAGLVGGLAKNAEFVVLGDLNASLKEGDAFSQSLRHLMQGLNIKHQDLPTSLGGFAHSPKKPWAKWHTASWRLCADYVLYPNWPHSRFSIHNQAVFWPKKSHPMSASVLHASDHRMIYLDLKKK